MSSNYVITTIKHDNIIPLITMVTIHVFWVVDISIYYLLCYKLSKA